MNKKSKKEKEVELYWNNLVWCFFQFCKKKFGTEPSFNGSAPRDMKRIIEVLKIRAAKSNVEWTEAEAIKRWVAFLEKAYEDDFLSKAFVLSNLDRFKDKIFFNTITPKKDYGTGTSFSQRGLGKTDGKPNPTVHNKGGFGKL